MFFCSAICLASPRATTNSVVETETGLGHGNLKEAAVFSL